MSLTMVDPSIEVMRSALRALGKGKVYRSPHTLLQPEQLNGFTFLKPAAVTAEHVRSA